MKRPVPKWLLRRREKRANDALVDILSARSRERSAEYNADFFRAYENMRPLKIVTFADILDELRGLRADLAVAAARSDPAVLAALDEIRASMIGGAISPPGQL